MWGIGHAVLSLISRLKSGLPSDTSALTALWVAVALIVLHGLFTVPSLWSNEKQLLRSASEQQRLLVEEWAIQNPYAELDGVPVGSSLLGITLFKPVPDGTGYFELVVLGDAPDLSLWNPANSGQIERSGDIMDAHWSLELQGQTLQALARVSVKHVVANNNSLVRKQILLALLSGLLGGLLVLLMTVKFFAKPIQSILVAIRESRANSDGNIPKVIEIQEAGDLQLIADEFNGLVDEQRKAARQVRVKQQYLEYAAHHDPLTHLSNRLMFEDRLKTTVAAAVAEQGQFSVFLVDLDNFKFFNDQYGHLIGDKMVVEVGSRLKAMMKDIDLVARLDGDEFVVIQKDIPDKQAAEEIAARVMSVVTAPFEYRGFTLKASVSVGISHFPDDVHADQDEEMLAEEIVNNAAVALQEAKDNGKNQYQLFSESMRSRLTARIRLEQDLKTALASEQFEVYYQPKINIHTRQVTGAEALVRWNHPTNGRISPEIFVPVAEEAGMIIELGEWILRTACRQTHMLQQIGYEGLNIAVNISAVQFTDGNLLPMVSKALQDSSLTPELLELEITESAVMHDPEEVIHSLHELSRFGMRLAIDDFGTGYSSLAYLKRFPVDTLKIDRAFITDISSDNDDVAIVEAVLGLGNHFNMKVVAEGVEDEDQLNFLREQGCDLAQGYFISQPMNIQGYIDWLEAWPHGIQGRDEVLDNITPLDQVRKAS